MMLVLQHKRLFPIKSRNNFALPSTPPESDFSSLRSFEDDSPETSLDYKKVAKNERIDQANCSPPQMFIPLRGSSNVFSVPKSRQLHYNQISPLVCEDLVCEDLVCEDLVCEDKEIITSFAPHHYPILPILNLSPLPDFTNFKFNF